MGWSLKEKATKGHFADPLEPHEQGGARAAPPAPPDGAGRGGGKRKDGDAGTALLRVPGNPRLYVFRLSFP